MIRHLLITRDIQTTQQHKYDLTGYIRIILYEEYKNLTQHQPVDEEKQNKNKL